MLSKAIKSSGSNRFLDGFRGGPVADLDALASLVVQVGDYALSLGDTLDVLDLNPVIITRDRPGGCIADARLILKGDEQ